MFVIDFAMAYYKRGKCYMMMHDYKRALYDFSAAILNDTRKSQTIFQQHGVKNEGGLALFYMCGGQCNYYLGQYEEALAHYEVAKQKDKKATGSDNKLKSQICYNMGLANASLMNYREAIKDQKKAIENSDQSK